MESQIYQSLSTQIKSSDIHHKHNLQPYATRVTLKTTIQPDDINDAADISDDHQHECKQKPQEFITILSLNMSGFVYGWDVATYCVSLITNTCGISLYERDRDCSSW